MTDKTTTVEIPEGAVALDATDTPLGLTANIVQGAPEPIRTLVYQQLQTFNYKLIARLSALTLAGPAIATKNLESFKDSFHEAMLAADKEVPHVSRDMTPALRLIAEDLADVIDKAAKSLLITARNEDYVNHDAYLDILEGHSMICAGLLGLNEVPADYKDDAATKH